MDEQHPHPKWPLKFWPPFPPGDATPKKRKRRAKCGTRRRRIWQRDKGICQYCGCKLTYNEATLDHVIPTSKGGEHTDENLVLACFQCNNEKGDQIGWKKHDKTT